MGVIVGFFVLVIIIAFIVGVIKASWNDYKSGEMDNSGNLHCKQCGCSSFVSEQDTKGNTIVRCAKCGYSWKIFR